MSLNLTGIREIRAPHPGRPKAHGEHCRACEYAAHERDRREAAKYLEPGAVIPIDMETVSNLVSLLGNRWGWPKP